MDISALTEQRREMVINLLKGMKIRKSDGEGFDKDDVYACMQQLCDVYEKSIDDLTVGYETEIGELQDKYQKYDENNDLYISLIMEAKKSSNEIINKAKSEVDEILAAGKEQIAAQETEIEQVRASVAQEKADLAAELEAAREAAEQEKADLAAGIEAEKQQAETVREQYRDQIAVMDHEFDEIKTNILRTAGKIDGLKAQLEDAGAQARWQIQDEPVAEEPAAEEPIAEDAAQPAEELTFEQLVAKLQEEDAAKAGQLAEVEDPAQAPVIEPEIEIPQEEAPAEEISAQEPAAEVEEVADAFHFEPVFDAPAQPEEAAEIAAEPVAEVTEAAEAVAEEIPAAPVEEIAPAAPAEIDLDEIAAEIPVEIPTEIPAADIAEELPTTPSLDDLAAAIPAEAPAAPQIDELNLDSVIAEAKEEVAPDVFSLDDVVADAKAEVADQGLGKIEDLALEDISIGLPEEPAAAAEEPIEEISFEGLEELFKD